MLLFLVPCFSFILLSITIPSCTHNLAMAFLAFQAFFISLAFFPPYSNQKGNHAIASKKNTKNATCLSDLPDLPLECILQRLSPSGLTRMSGVSRSFRALCTQDHLWERHLSQKWGELLMGDSVRREWQAFVDANKRQAIVSCSNGKGYFGVFTSSFWWKKKEQLSCSSSVCLPCDSVMAWYLSLESGNFSFPAQVYNRENGNVGFLLSSYDAKVSYDSNTDSFKARYSARGRPTLEENVVWERLRSPAVDTAPFDLHVSGCLNDLKPGDHIEIQWRKSKEFPYGWWYGVVGHLESCDGNKLYCQCHRSDTIILEFKQYNPGSRWREVVIDRKDHREVGNETDGFYAGIRKLYKENEIVMWKGLWPAQPLE